MTDLASVTVGCPKSALYKMEVDAMKAALDAIEVFDKALEAAGAYANGRINIGMEEGPVGELVWDEDSYCWRFLPMDRNAHSEETP